MNDERNRADLAAQDLRARVAAAKDALQAATVATDFAAADTARQALAGLTADLDAAQNKLTHLDAALAAVGQEAVIEQTRAKLAEQDEAIASTRIELAALLDEVRSHAVAAHRRLRQAAQIEDEFKKLQLDRNASQALLDGASPSRYAREAPATTAMQSSALLRQIQLASPADIAALNATLATHPTQ